MTPIAPKKMQLIAVDNPAIRLIAQFNPSEVRESLAPVWASHRVPGLSHPVKQYSYTDAREISFTLEFNADMPGANIASVAYARKFLTAMCYSARGAQGIPQGQPSRIMFSWPKVISMTSHITNVDTTWEAFNYGGDIIRYSARVSLAEIRDTRLYADDILNSDSLSVLAPE